jgi:integration host factor subunit beta
MTKTDLVEEVARVIEVSRKDAYVIIETILDSMVRSLRNGERIEIRGLGSFHTRQRKGRLGRNPKTGARVIVPPKRIPYFRPSKELKELVNSLVETEVSEPTPVSLEPTMLWRTGHVTGFRPL